ncbi:sodium-coupled neutral amino acid transporter 9 homolog isoform X1 [Apis mellifera]|uniref:Sodium-coupled neutral amino acid transporter 9 homolog isoform X1 n=1 Tax=Apis mellifera TaxID=7460 RepID=A0A7M7R9Z8_APIME|nr:sodium-coupled neutral amino acid transporter 9 homolog isoform X1 [Apis mellifera]|eukprot:XP_624412.2 sodium-coupled neutral amino acid transporter 9 homolog isoform X1 [Apis mellifera]
MYKYQNAWKPCIHHDSGSESAPLISSGSHISVEPVIFQDSETSDLEYIPTNSYFKYGSLETCNLHSNITIIPKKSVTENHTLVTSLTLNTCSSLNVIQDRCYEIHNTDLEIVEDTCKDIKSKQSSLVTIFSIWNTILGSSLLTIPWGIQMAGFFPGILLILIMSGLCLYTAYCLLLVYNYYGEQKNIEVIQLCQIYLNKWAEYVAKIFSITVLLGATIAYWVLMSNFLYNSVNFIYDSVVKVSQFPIIDNTSFTSEVLCPKKITYNSTNFIMHDYTYSTLGPLWDLYKTVPIFLGLLIFPFLNFNSPTFFAKFNSLGTISIIYLIVFILIKSYSWGINMNEIEWKTSWTLKFSFPALSGMLALSFFIHNIIITIMQNNYDQSKNGRDLSIAYLLVTLTYITVGIVFYVCFPLNKSCIEDNLLNNFQKWSGLTVGARIVLLFQLLTVYPLLAYMLRIQLLTSICKIFNTGCVIIINIILVSVCIFFAVFVPYIGTIIRYTGALSGFIYIFTLPSLLYLVILKEQKKLTIFSLFLHISILIFGFLNLLAQFFITEY